jgi:DNA-binding CsgD family transcriptional regulator
MRLRIRSQTQLEEYLLHVRLNGALGDEEAVGDSLVREAFADEAQDFALAVGKVGERIHPRAAADDLGDDGRVDHRLAVGDAAERIEEERDVEDAVLEQVADSLGMLLERTGYLLKDRVSDMAVLADAIRRIDRGECVIDPTIVSQLMNRRRRGGAVAALTDDERNLLALVAEGHSNKSISERFGVDPDGVEEDVRGLFAKLEIDTAPNDVRRALAVLASMRS